jgi:hypothetical protein
MPNSLALYNVTTVPVATAALVPGTCLMGYLIYGGSADSSVEFKNALTDTGTTLLSDDTLAKVGKFVDLSDIGGVRFTTGIFVKPTGAGSIVYTWTA